MSKIKKTAIGCAASILITTVLLLIASLAVLKIGKLPEKGGIMLSTVVYGISVLLASALTARMAGEKGLLHGLVVAAVYTAIYTAVVLSLAGTAGITDVILRALVILLSGAVGGIAGVNRKGKVKF